MKSTHFIARGLLLMAALCAPLAATEEPEELTTLRKLYLRQIERQLEQPKRVYATELQKLERKLSQDGRLEEALLVKRERESLAQPTTGVPDTRKPQNAADLQTALENTTWEYTAKVPGQPDVRYVILLPGGIIVFGWNNTRGTWKATAPNRIEIESITPAAKYTGVMKIAPDLSEWDGTWSSDAFERSGRRVARTPADD